MDLKQIGIPAMVVIVSVVVGWLTIHSVRKQDPLQEKEFMTKGMDKPVAWMYYNTSDVNSRNWYDFGARSTRVINVPFLNLCYEAAVKQLSDTYRVEVIGGLSDLADRLGGWNQLPTPLQNPNKIVNEPELNWIRAAVLAKWGGLWVSPSTVWIKPLGPLPKEKVVFFGTDTDVSFAGSSGTGVPGLRVVWSPQAQHPLWTSWERKARARLERRSGGSEFRQDEKSDTADALAEFTQTTVVLPTAELGRKGGAGKRIQLEDLLMAGQEGNLPFDIKCDAVYAFLPWPEVQRRSNFGWFLRMSEDQILNSDLVVSWIFKLTLNTSGA
jgi:hypothetical protein